MAVPDNTLLVGFCVMPRCIKSWTVPPTYKRLLSVLMLSEYGWLIVEQAYCCPVIVYQITPVEW
jgi:hypothetical protein